jgi:AcrR family transcriptional regulator
LSRAAAGTAGASARKRAAVLDAAARLFLEAGYGATSMDQVAAAAGVAKQTLYNQFGSKEALFRAIVEDLVRELVGPLAHAAAGGAPERVLEAFGRRFLGLMLRPSSLALHRLLVAETNRFPELAHAVFDAGPVQAVQALAGWLRAQHAHGRLAVAQPALAAEQFLGMLTGHIQLRALFGVCVHPGDAALDAAIAHAVATFLAAHRARPGVVDSREA